MSGLIPLTIVTKVIGEDLKIVFEGSTTINGTALIEIAKSKEAIAKSKGQKFTEDAVPFWGGELVNLVKQGVIGKEMDHAATQVGMAAWLCEKLYNGVSEKEFLQSSLVFTMLPNGIVLYDRNKIN